MLLSHHKRWLAVGSVLVLSLALLHKRCVPKPPWPYCLTALVAPGGSKSDAHEQALSSKKACHLLQQAHPSVFALWQRLQGHTTASRTGVPLHQGERKAALPATLLLTARLCKTHHTHDGDGVVVCLEEALPDLPKGTFLFGVVRFAKNRLFIRFTTAQHEGRCWPVHCIAYDQDFLPGLSYPDLASSALKHPLDRLVDKFVGRAEASVWRMLRTTRTALLASGRLLYVESKGPKKRRRQGFCWP